MLLDLIEDYALLVPGEVIEHVPSGRRITVYPAGVYHVARMSPLYSTVKAAEDEASATALLLGPAHPLLACCCVPPLVDRTGDVAELAAASWLRQSADPPVPESSDDVGGDRKRRTISFGEAIADLVGAGHRVPDVLHLPGVGVDGRPLPYPGWTVPQLFYYWQATQRRLVGMRAEAMAAPMSAIVGTFGDDEGKEAVRELLEKLREIAERPMGRRAAPPPVSEPTPEEIAAAFPVLGAAPRPTDLQPVPGTRPERRS